MHYHFTTSSHPYNLTRYIKSVTYFQPYENGDYFKYALFKSTNLLATVSTFYENFHASNSKHGNRVIVTSRHFIQ